MDIINLQKKLVEILFDSFKLFFKIKTPLKLLNALMRDLFMISLQFWLIQWIVQKESVNKARKKWMVYVLVYVILR